MSSVPQNVIKHKVGLVKLAAELGGGSICAGAARIRAGAGIE